MREQLGLAARDGVLMEDLLPQAIKLLTPSYFC